MEEFYKGDEMRYILEVKQFEYIWVVRERQVQRYWRGWVIIVEVEELGLEVERDKE